MKSAQEILLKVAWQNCSKRCPVYHQLNTQPLMPYCFINRNHSNKHQCSLRITFNISNLVRLVITCYVWDALSSGIGMFNIYSLDLLLLISRCFNVKIISAWIIARFCAFLLVSKDSEVCKILSKVSNGF